MGRPGVTEYAVRQAINELLAQGTDPSVKKVQAIVGGSNTTIGAFLRKINDENGGMFGDGGIVEKELTQVVRSLHDRLKVIADQTVAAGAIEAEKAVNAARADTAREQLAHADTARLLTEAQAALDLAQALTASLVEKLNTANSQIAGDAQVITLLQVAKTHQAHEIERLQREGELRQVAFEAFQNSSMRAREATEDANTRDRKALMDAHESALNDMRQEREKLTHDRSELTIQNGVLTRDNERLAQEIIAYGKNLRSAQDAQRDLQAKVDTATNEVSDVRIAAAEVKGQVILLTQQLTESNAHRDNAVAALQSARSDIEGLTSLASRQQSDIEALSTDQPAPKSR